LNSGPSSPGFRAAITPRPARAGFIRLALGLVLAGCDGAPASGTGAQPAPARSVAAATSLAALPDLGGVDPDVAARLRDAHARAAADPEDAAARYELACTLEANRFLPEALGAHREAARLDPAAPRPRYRAALLLAELADYPASREELRAAVALAPDYAPAHWRSGLAELDAGALDQAERAFDRAIELDPKSYGGWVGRARLALMRDDPEAALAAVRRVGELRPRDRYPIALLGSALRALGRLDEAARASASAAGAIPHFDDPWSEELARFAVPTRASELDRAHELYRAGALDGAIAVLEALLAEDGDDVEVLNQLGSCLGTKGRYPAARRAWERSLELDPDQPHTELNLGQLLATLGERDEALARIDAVIASTPRSARAHSLRGDLCAEADRPSEAVDAWRSALEHDPGLGELHVRIGAGLLELRRWEEAAESFEAAVAEEGGSGAALLGLARARFELGRLPQAEELLQRLARLPQSAPPRLRPDPRLLRRLQEDVRRRKAKGADDERGAEERTP